MKKFFSLVLALVMALSLTTVAWGADAADLAALTAVVTTGGEVKLTADIDINVTTGTQDRLVVAQDLVVDLNGHKLFSADAADDIFYVQDGASLTVKNGTLDSARLGIYSNGSGTDANVIKLDNVKINSDYFGVYHNGNNYGADVTIENSTITDNGGAGVFLSGSKAWAPNQLSKLTITNSTVQGATAVEVKYADVVVTNSTLKATATGTATMQFNDNGSNTAGYALALTHSGGSGGSEDATGSITVNSGNVVGAVGIQESGNTAAGTAAAETANTDDAAITVSGGTFTDDVSAYVAPGYVFANGSVVNNAGNFVGSSSALTSSTATYGATLADALANKTHTVEVKAALEASASLKSFQTYQVFVTKLADKTVSVLPNQYIVVPTDVNADVVVVDGSKIIFLAQVAGVTKYDDNAEAVKVAYNAKPACDDVYVASAADAGVYYLYKNAYYVECDAVSADKVFNVDGVAVAAKATNLVKTLAHTYAFDTKTVGTKTEVTKVYCTVCKDSFSFVVGDLADAVKTFGAGNYADTGLNDANGDDIFVRTASGLVYVPVTPSTDKVQSADTFDAGIAMYVGMSVMAAAGSAVVIGKKKD